MKTYWRIGLVALVLAVILGVIIRNLEWEEYTVPVELRGDAARNPFYAAEHFARSLGAQTQWRQTLGDLPPPPAVLVLQYWQWNLIASRRVAIEHWVEAGGRLVLYGPLWDDDELFGAWSGLFRQYSARSDVKSEEDEDIETSEDEDADEPADEPGDEKGCWALSVMQDVNGASKGHASYRLCTKSSSSGHLTSNRVPQWSLRDRDGMQAVRVPRGRGSVTWLNVAEVFGNRNLANAEHGLLFVALTQLRPGDQFIFLLESGHPSLLALIWKHGAAVVVLAGLALLALLWRSAIRFGPPAAVPELARRSLVEQIRGTGLFVRRFGSGTALHAAGLRALYEAAQRRIPHWSSLSQAQRVLALARAADVSATEIREVLRDDPRSSHELERALAQLERARRRLMAGEN